MHNITFEELSEIPPGNVIVDEAGLIALRAAGWEAQPAGMSTDFRQNWTMWSSLREFVQNALDATQTVDIAIVRGNSGQAMTLVGDDGAGFPVVAMRLGQRKGTGVQLTDQQKLYEKTCLRGRFGEGMKFGIIPVMRAGGRVLIRTVGFDATYISSTVTMLGESVNEIMLLLRRNKVTKGTTVAIEGLDAAQFEDEDEMRLVDLRLRFVPTLTLMNPSVVLMTSRGGVGSSELLFNPPYSCMTRQILNKPGHIYVRDIYVETRKKTLLGYNFWFDDSAEALDPNRDHLKYDPYSTPLVKEMRGLFMAEPTYFTKLLLTALNGLPEEDRRDTFEWMALDHLFDTYSVGVSKEYADKVHEVIKTIIGHEKYAFAESTREEKFLEHMSIPNMTKVIPEGFKNLLEFHRVIDSVKKLQADVGSSKQIPIGPKEFAQFCKKVVDDVDQERLKKMTLKQFNFLHKGLQEIAASVTMKPSVKVVLYVGDNADKHCGLTNGETIYIALTQLDKLRLFETLIHECAHIISDMAPDVTESFEKGLESAAVRFMNYASQNAAKIRKMTIAATEVAYTQMTVHPVNGKMSADRTVSPYNEIQPKYLVQYLIDTAIVYYGGLRGRDTLPEVE